MDWDDVRSFLAIARARSLSGAARDLGVRQSTMSRRLDALEAKAGARLLQRTSAGYELTPLGEAVLGNAERMEAEAIAVDRIVQGRDVALTGTVRVTTVEYVAEKLLPQAIARLHARHPGITVDVLSDPRSFNLSRREADLAIRMTRFEGNQLVSRRMATAASGLYVSESYLAARGNQAANRDHAIITVLEDQAHLPEALWLNEQLPQARVVVRSNDRSVQCEAVAAGLGAGCLPCFMADSYRGLIRLPGSSQGPDREVWLGVHADLRHMPRIRAFIEAFDAIFSDNRDRFAGKVAD